MDRGSPEAWLCLWALLGVRLRGFIFCLFNSVIRLLGKRGARHFLFLSLGCSVSRPSIPRGCVSFSSFKQAGLSARAARMDLFPHGHRGYWSFSNLLLLQPYFCWANLNLPLG